MTENGYICLKPPFTWNIIDFHEVINKHCGEIFSPNFTYRGAKFYLSFKNGFFSKSTFYLCPVDPRGVLSLSVSYCLIIMDTEGREYWSSDLKTIIFTYCDRCGCHQFVSLQDLQRDFRKITRGSVLSLRLKFYPEDPPISPTVQDERSTTITVGTQTCEELSQFQACSSRPDNARSTTITVGTQTGDELSQFQACSSRPDGVDLVMQKYKDLFLSGQKSDVIFKVKAVELKAHKCILAAQSSVLGRMFGHEMQEKSTSVQITDSDPVVFKVFLQYLYTGQVETLSVESALELYCVADKYAVDALRQFSVEFLQSNMSVEYFYDILSLGIRHGEVQLVKSAEKYFAQNMRNIISTDKWLVFIAENTKQANDLLLKNFNYANFRPK